MRLYKHTNMIELLQKIFGFDKGTMSLKKEVLAGVTTFLTMAYILAVNPSFLGAAGMDTGAVFTASAIASIVATLVMALYAKLPFALAPGMGLNAFFAYTIVLTMGYTWQFALTAVLIEGLIFILLTLTGLRQKMVACMPLPLRRAISPGIGLFIAFVGLQNAGIITGNPATLVTLGNMHDMGVLLACMGILLTGFLLVRKVTGALLIGIMLTTLAGIPMGVTHIDKIASLPPSLAPGFCQFEWGGILSMDMAICVLTLLFMDLFDTIGTLVGVGSQCGMMDEKGNMPRLKQAFMADAVGTTVGAILGTSTVSTFMESAAGVQVGGRSGVTSFVTAMCFVLALLLAPLFLAVPSQATAAALVLVGVMMMRDMRNIDWSDYLTAIPVFICVLFMPLCYSISDGIMMSLISWVVLHLLSGKWRELNPGMVILSILFVAKYMFL